MRHHLHHRQGTCVAIDPLLLTRWLQVRQWGEKALVLVWEGRSIACRSCSMVSVAAAYATAAAASTSASNAATSWSASLAVIASPPALRLCHSGLLSREAGGWGRSDVCEARDLWCGEDQERGARGAHKPACNGCEYKHAAPTIYPVTK